ncbi:SMP-30/gluconolactonase/LRE family protein [Mycolicibacterium gilvum]|uniref:SMP-30/gluconolactonase/LRE family protein n=1 Tax=Mycolicibacterium gilvum TaxID=1804 RepID=UPI0040461732
MIVAERLTGCVTHHGEGPFWDAVNNRLLVLDVLAGAVVEIGLSGEATRHELPTPVATMIRRRRSGGFAISTGNGVIGTDEAFGDVQSIATITDDPALRTNDGGCDPLGGLVVGTMAYDEQPDAGTVYRVSPDGSVGELLAPVTISNGVQWSADGRRVFYIDTPTGRVDVFDVDPVSGGWLNRRSHIHIDREFGHPDGMAIDENDGLWIALWGGGAVNHYDSLGRLVTSIRVPGVTQTSSCAFGGRNGDTLFITTSRQGLLPHQEPAAGSVFMVQAGVRGASIAEFEG